MNAMLKMFIISYFCEWRYFLFAVSSDFLGKYVHVKVKKMLMFF